MLLVMLHYCYFRVALFYSSKSTNLAYNVIQNKYSLVFYLSKKSRKYI